MIQMHNTKFEVCAMISFSVIIITGKCARIHTHTLRLTAKNVIFEFRFPQNLQIYQNLYFENFEEKVKSEKFFFK